VQATRLDMDRIRAPRRVIDPVEVVCVQPAGAPAMTWSWQQENRDRFAGRHVVTIVCGSNVDQDKYRRWVGL
jgi:threonine dehydratase